MNRNIGNQMLWIVFNKDFNNQYRLTINGPLTNQGKDSIAHELIRVMGKIIEHDNSQITDLIV